MTRRALLVLAYLALVAPLPARAQVKVASDVFPARKITFQPTPLSVADALDQMHKQTGITLTDKRAVGQNANIKPAAEYPGFWQALDAVAAEAGAAVSLYQPNNAIALVEGKPPLVAPSYHSIFRTTVKRVSAEQDFDTGNHQCRLWLELAWEPWFKPLYVQVNHYKAAYAPGLGQPLVAEGKLGWVAAAEKDSSKHALELDWRMPAPDRAAATLASLTGDIHVIGPEKMLTVTFDKLKAGSTQKQVIDGITISQTLTVNAPPKGPAQWDVKIQLAYPPGGPTFDSYQTWLTYNGIALQAAQNPKLTVKPGPFPFLSQQTSNEATITYSFKEDTKAGAVPLKLGSPADWNLVYITPGRIVEVAVPFAFKNIPLP